MNELQPDAPLPFSEPETNLFGGTEESSPMAAPSNPDVAERTAQLAAFAGINVSEQAGNIFATMEERTQAYRDQIQMYGDSEARAEAAARAKEARLGALQGVLDEALPGADPELTKGAVLAYNNIATADNEADRRYELERQAVENIQNLAAAGDMTQARVMLSNLENGNALDVVRDYNAKQLMLQSLVDKAQVAVENQGWMASAANFVLSILPLNSSMSNVGNVPIDKALKNWYDNLLSGERVKNEADSLWDMPIEEFSKFVNEDFIKNLHDNATLLGYTNNNEQLQLLTQLAVETPSALETNSWNALDIAGLVPVAAVTKVGRAAMGLPSLMIRNGASREAAELVAKAALDVTQDSTAAAAKAGLSVEELGDALAVKAVNPTGGPSTVGIAGIAGEAMERGRAAFAIAAGDLEKTTRLTAEEAAHAESVIRERLARQFDREIKNVNVVDVDLTGGSSVRRIEFMLGRKSGNGFANEGQANRYLTSIGEAGQAIQDESGQWFAKLNIDMPEEGFYTNLLKVQTSSPTRYILNARNISDINLANDAQVAGNKRNALLFSVVKQYEKTFRSLGALKDDLALVMQRGEIEGTWFTEDQLGEIYNRAFKRQITPKELEAYNAARDINDMEFALRSEDIYKARQIRGYRTGTFDTGLGRIERENLIVDRELKDIPRERFYDVSAGKHYPEGVNERQWERMRGQGYIKVTLEEPKLLADGTTIKTYLVKGPDVQLENLRMDQVSYRAGGHRMYRGKYFVKQTREGVQPDTGKKYLKNPDTYIAAETRAEADFWATRMEAARQAFVRGDGLDVIDDILGGHAGLPDAEQFVKDMKDGVYDKNHKFDTYGDREMPTEYNTPGAGLDFVDMEDTGFNGFLRTHGRMYTGRKGAQLRDYQGELAPVLDPYETINRSLMNISSLSSFSDYKLQSVERWMKTFGRHLNVRDLEDASDMRKFMEAPLVKGGNLADQRIASQAEAQRTIIKRTLGWRTPNDIRSEQYANRLYDWVAGSRVDGVLPNARKKIVNWVQDANPVSALRGFAFDLKLGLFNVAQLPLQLSTAFAATALSPKRGMQGWAMIAPMRYALGSRQLGKEAFEGRLDELIKRGVHGLGGFDDPKEFKEFARAAQRSGFFDLGGTHGLLDHYGPHSTLNGFGSTADRAREGGRFFFYESERWNRIVAWRIAWDEAKEKFPTMGKAEPRKVYYHGSKNPDIKEFKSGNVLGGIYFAEKKTTAKMYAPKEGKVYEKYLDIKNPYIVKDSKYASGGLSADDIKELKAQGYDAVINKTKQSDKTGSWYRDETIVFDPKQIRDVTGEMIRPNQAEFSKFLAGRAEEYSFNMSRESQSWWQKGLLSIPTQFWAYNARMLEAMTVGNFTKAQKLRLIASQGMLYGSAGLPGVSLLSEHLKGSTGKVPGLGATDPRTGEENGVAERILAGMDRGLIDTFVYNATGADVLVGRRYGSGGWITDTVREIFGMSQYGPTSAADVLGGATFSILGTVGKTVEPVIKYMAAESGSEDQPLARDSLVRMASNISTVGNFLKAMMVFKYGTYVSNSGATSVTDLPSSTAFAVALGIQPAELDQVTAMRTYLNHKKEAVREASTIINNYRVDMLNRPDQAESIQNDVNAFVRLLPEEIRAQALAQAHSRVDPSLYESLVQRMERQEAFEGTDGQPY